MELYFSVANINKIFDSTKFISRKSKKIAVAIDAIICTMKLLIGQSKSNSANYSAIL